jgi:uncharacterized membrane protein
MAPSRVSLHIDAPASTVWRHLMDVERWPDWAPTVTEVERLDDGPLDVGTRIRAKQPKLLPMVWHVSELESDRVFGWRTGNAGAAAIATHSLAPREAGGVDFTLSIRFHGVLGPLAELLLGRRARRDVAAVAHGLQRVCRS